LRRFHFELEKVLSLRTGKEKEARLELGRTIGVLTETEAKICRVAEEQSAASVKRFAQGHGAAEIRSYDLYILRLEQTKDALLEEAAKAELAVEKARASYLEASRERKVLEKLKERRKKEHRRAAFAEETMMLDDVSGGRTARSLIASAM
jgi:flagellar FliJ protein